MALRGLYVIEVAGLAPVPFCGMLLSDYGARVIRIDKPNTVTPSDVLDHGKESVAIDLKNPAGVGLVRHLCKKADVLIEPFRPGVMEKIGLGPKVLMAENPRLIYARLTGYGQEGSLSRKAGHDINYIAMSGVLSKLGRRGENPYPPINLVADFAGGGLLCAFGILAALQARNSSGQGQVVDASMTEGSAYIASWLDATKSFLLPNERGTNLLDGGTSYYNTYKTKDNQYMAVGAIEPQFYANLIKGLDLKDCDISQLDDMKEQIQLFAKIFLTKTRDEWIEVFKDLDACVTPILDVDEAAEHDHNKSRNSFRKNTMGEWQSNPSPKLSLTPPIKESEPRPNVGQHNESVLAEFGFSKQEVDDLFRKGAFGKTSKL